MSVELYLDGRLVQERADAAGLGVALIALRGRDEAELELAGPERSLVLEKNAYGLHVSLVDDHGASDNLVGCVWDAAVEAAAEFLAGLPGRPGGLLAEFRTPLALDDDCPLCRAMKEEPGG